MRYLFFICRFIFGVTFIISGLLKLIDPVGTGLVVTEYFKVLYLGFMDFSSLPVGIMLSITEFLVGISVLSGIKIKSLSPVAFTLIAFFTALTLYIAIFNPVSDCGCFGEAIHLSNWQTFFKNIVLLLCILPIFIHRRKFGNYFPSYLEWYFIASYVAFALTIAIYSSVRMPFVEFGDFKVGSNISANLEDSQQAVDYETVLIYEKNGKSKEFSLDNLPDSTWVFLDSRTLTNDAPAVFDFSVSNMQGEYITDKILDAEYPLYVAVITKIDAIASTKKWSYFKGIDSLVHEKGGEFMFLVSAIPDTLNTIINRYSLQGMSFGLADYKTLISLQRSNGGIVYLNDANVVQKWSKFRLDEEGIQESITGDYELLASNRALMRQFYLEILLLLILLSLVFARIAVKIYRKTIKAMRMRGNAGTRRTREDG